MLFQTFDKFFLLKNTELEPRKTGFVKVYTLGYFPS